MDYTMSEKFGIGWTEMDYPRAMALMVVMNERAKMENEHGRKSDQPKFRPRM